MDSTTALEISMLGETASLDSDSWLSKQSNLKVSTFEKSNTEYIQKKYIGVVFDNMHHLLIFDMIEA
ncbi:hypothetical protein BRADI_4g32215v3 [Brachypodium distachyon]|uniref:Uncharacterized protein n=1 Tax=Brachypodium distachyon TaxID=15368 RepID=A0A2K2CRQ7_BRADI|nr:hypothetical protein BRADI_4g32215v3 [Brachypodium distachyon]